jgi:hypothetical protein
MYFLRIVLKSYFKYISATRGTPPLPVQTSQTSWVGVRIQYYWAYIY